MIRIKRIENPMPKQYHGRLPSKNPSKGSALLYVVLAMLLIATLSIPLFRLIPTSSFTDVDTGNQIQAMYLARAGLDYAEAWLCREGLEADDWPPIELGPEFLGSAGMVNINFSMGNPTQREYTVVSQGNTPSSSMQPASFRLNRTITCGTISPFPTTPAEYVFYSGGGAMTIPHQGNVDGSVYGDSVTLGNQVTVTGDAIAKTTVTLVNHATLGGSICSGESVIMGSHTEVGGDIHAHGNVTVGSNASIVRGDIFASGNVIIENLSQVLGNVHAGGNVILYGNNSVIHGNVYAQGTVTLLSNNTRIGGNVNANSNVTLGWNTTIQGNVTTRGNIDLSAGRGSIGGNATAGGSITLGQQSSIGGSQSPGHPNPGVIAPTPPQTCPNVPKPNQSAFTAGTTHYSIGWQQNQSLPPGNYGNLTTGGANNIYFTNTSPGQCRYVFNSMQFAWDLKLYLDLSQCYDNGAPGSLTIFSVNDISFLGKVSIFVKTDSAGGYSSMNDVPLDTAKRIYWETYGAFSQGSQSQWFGTILAGNNISFGTAEIIGAYASVNGVVTVGPGSDIVYKLAYYAEENW